MQKRQINMSIEDKKETRQLSSSGLTFQNILDLPDDVLYLIFKYCDIQSLGRLCSVCKYLNKVASKDHIWRSRYLTLLSNTTRDSSVLSVKEAIRLSINRVEGYYYEFLLLKYHAKLLPWMQFDSKELWLSVERRIRCFQKSKNRSFREVRERVLSGLSEDVSRFVVRGNRVVSGCRDGSIHMWDKQSCRHLFKFDNVHSGDVQAVDFHDNTIVSGSRDASLKILSCDKDDVNYSIKADLPAGDRVWSVAVSPCGTICASGTAFCRGEAPVGVWDLDRACLMSHLGQDNRIGAGVLDMKFETPHLLLTCGYDTNVKLWDMRSLTCVCKWEEPDDSAIYCLQTDNDMTMFTGTARHGMIRLWDKRKVKPLQVYYCGFKTSPVYSLCFDERRLYSALDHGAYILDFSRR